MGGYKKNIYALMLQLRANLNLHFKALMDHPVYQWFAMKEISRLLVCFRLKPSFQQRILSRLNVLNISINQLTLSDEIEQEYQQWQKTAFDFLFDETTLIDDQDQGLIEEMRQWLRGEVLSIFCAHIDELSDDLVLSTCYQAFYHDNREALDLKLLQGQKLENSMEIADKTQLFTDRYMVDWMVQNTLLPFWFEICRNQGWHEEEAFFSQGYYIDQIKLCFTELKPSSLSHLKIIDPAMGTGNFLVVLMDLLFKLYQREAYYRGQTREGHEIINEILSQNLYGLDICPRVFTIALVNLLLKAISLTPEIHLTHHHLVHTSCMLSISSILASKGYQQLKSKLTARQHDAFVKLITDIAQLSQLGALLDHHALQVLVKSKHYPIILDLIKAYTHFSPYDIKSDIGAVLELLCLQYELVITNPPYFGIAGLAKSTYLTTHYPIAKSDLYSAFWLKASILTKSEGLCAMLTLRNWMFLQSFQRLREYLLSFHLVLICDLKAGAFAEIVGNIVNTTMTILQKIPSLKHQSIPILFEPAILRTGRKQFANKKALLLNKSSMLSFDPRLIDLIPGKPLVYWWPKHLYALYQQAQILENQAEVKIGLQTGYNDRFIRKPWEIDLKDIWLSQSRTALDQMGQYRYVPYIKGASGQKWFTAVHDVIDWWQNGLVIKSFRKANGKTAAFVRNESYYFRQGVAYTTVGSKFSARWHLYLSIFDVSGASIFHDNPQMLKEICCFLNSQLAQEILNTLNPTVNYQANDIKRLPILSIQQADQFYETLKVAFEAYEKSQETSIFFEHPQINHQWFECQKQVEASINQQFLNVPSQVSPSQSTPSQSTPSQSTPSQSTPSQSTPSQALHQDIDLSWISYLIGVILDRFHLPHQSNSSLFEKKAKIPGLLWLPRLNPSHLFQDGLLENNAQPLCLAWQAYCQNQKKAKDLKSFILDDFFKYHLKQYEQRPIYWLMSSKNKNFNILIYMKKLNINMIEDLKKNYLMPALEELKKAERKKKTKIDQPIAELITELNQWITALTSCFQKGPGQQHEDQSYTIDVNDGVLVNAAPLWPLLDQHWEEPKKVWQALVNPRIKDYDWSKVAMRYFKERVIKKCQADISLAYSHQLHDIS